jgi:hypothetical protein
MGVQHGHGARRPAITAVLLLVAVAAMVMQGAALPHTHAGAPGLYNQEHDLTLYAAAGSAALVDAVPPLFVDVVLTALPFVVVSRPPSAFRAHGDCRAPPTA